MTRTYTATPLRAAEFLRESPDDAGRIPVVVSTDAVVEVVDGPEILVHSADSVDLARAPLPIIATHAGGQVNVGVIEDIRISGGQMRGMARFGDRAEADGYKRDVLSGVIRSVSVGYRRVKGFVRSDNVLMTTRWQPRHAALVAEPADPGAGFYRAAEPDVFTPDLAESSDRTEPSEVLQQRSAPEIPAPSAGAHPSQGDRSMDQTQAPAAEQTTATPTAATRAASVTDNNPAIAAERERARQIGALGRQAGMTELADKAIDNGSSLESFRALVTDKLLSAGKIRPAESPDIGMSEREMKQYSFCRALLAAQDPLHAHEVAPFETECARAAQDKRGDSRDKTREAAITIPVDMLSRGITLGAETARGVTQRLIAQAARSSREMQALYRDLVAGTTTAGGNVVATELWGSSFIDLLRNAMVLDKLGITWLRDLNGNVAIPSQTGGATAYWVAEGGAPTESQATFGQVVLTPKTVAAYTDYSRRLLLQASIDVEAFVRADLAMILGLEIQRAALNGSGTSNEPTGLLNINGIGSVAGGTNGLAPAYSHLVDLETAIGNSNGDTTNLAYLTNTKVRGTLRKTQEFASTNGKPVWTSMAGQPGVGEVLGYGAYVTNAVPSNLTKGTSSGVCSAIVAGNWIDLMIGLWGGLDILLDPYTGGTSGTRRVVAMQDVDVAARQVASFAAMKDALTS